MDTLGAGESVPVEGDIGNDGMDCFHGRGKQSVPFGFRRGLKKTRRKMARRKERELQGLGDIMLYI